MYTLCKSWYKLGTVLQVTCFFFFFLCFMHKGFAFKLIRIFFFFGSNYILVIWIFNLWTGLSLSLSLMHTFCLHFFPAIVYQLSWWWEYNRDCSFKCTNIRLSSIKYMVLKLTSTIDSKVIPSFCLYSIDGFF